VRRPGRRSPRVGDAPVEAGEGVGVTTDLHEEVLEPRVERVPAGAVRARTVVDTERARTVVGRATERGEVERVTPAEGDSGEIETLADGSVSIPVFEEELVVEKRLVVRERIIIRKTSVVEEQVVEADLRRQQVVIETDGDIADRVHDAT